jgi:hypothetical protein
LDPVLSLAYIELLCKNEPEKIVDELRKYNFPMAQSLELCEKHNILHPMAYLKAKLGCLEESFDIYTKLLMEYLDNILLNLNPKFNIKNELIDLIFTYRCTVELCEDAIKNNYQNNLEYFNNLAKMLLKFYVTNFILERKDKMNLYYKCRAGNGHCYKFEEIQKF